jgi:protein-tyrosine phosphatase
MVDVELYGGKRGFLEHMRARALYALGAYRGSDAIEWAAVGRLAFVCKGNICRSPYASAKALSLGIAAASFGLDAREGEGADPVALKNSAIRGMDLSSHRSARLDATGLEDGDLVIVFEPLHLAEVRRRLGNRTPVSLLGIWSRPLQPHIQDPYGRSDRYFQRCFSVIDANIAKLVEHMARNAAPAARDLAPDVRRAKAMHRNPCKRMRD